MGKEAEKRDLVKASFFASKLNLTHILGRAKRAHGLSSSWAEHSTGFGDSCTGSFVTRQAQTWYNAPVWAMMTIILPQYRRSWALLFTLCLTQTLLLLKLHFVLNSFKSLLCLPDEKKKVCLRAEETLTTWHSLNENFLLLVSNPSLQGCRKKRLLCATRVIKSSCFFAEEPKIKTGDCSPLKTQHKTGEC